MCEDGISLVCDVDDACTADDTQEAKLDIKHLDSILESLDELCYQLHVMLYRYNQLVALVCQEEKAKAAQIGE